VKGCCRAHPASGFLVALVRTQTPSPMQRYALLALLLLPLAASAQNGQGSLQVAVGVPQGAFSEGTDGAIGFGLSGQLLWQVPRTPVALGGELGFLIYGQERIREQFGGGALGRVDVDVITQNNIALGHFVFRLQPPSGTFRPYVDGLLGLGYLYTDSRIQDVSGARPEIASSTNYHDLAFSYGGGAGVAATVFQGVQEKTGRPYQVAVDVRLRYLEGGEAEYLRRGSIQQDSRGNLTYDVSRSRTSLLLPQVGLAFQF